MPCFEQGLLYRIKDEDSWYFYNDSADHEMRVMYTFGQNSEIETGPKTIMSRQSDGSLRCSMTVLPGETQHLMSGHAIGFKSHFEMRPLSDELLNRMRRDCQERIAGQTTRMMRRISHVADELQQVTGLSSSRVQFVDTSFPPGESSLAKSHAHYCRGFPWMRPEEFLPARHRKRVRVAFNVQPGDISQGELGDSGFLCAAAALSEFPDVVQRAFVVDSHTAAMERIGAHRVRLLRGGMWCTIIVDSFLPVRGLRLAFARSKSDPAEMWIPLLQKAYAKLLGSYFDLLGVSVAQLLHAVTGFPCTRLDAEWQVARTDYAERQQLLRSIVRCNRAQHIVVLNTPAATDRAFAAQFGCPSTSELAARFEHAGLSLGYSYMLLRVVVVHERGIFLVKLRNPFQRDFEWSGAWADTSDMWDANPDIAALCGFSKEAANVDGCFWMDFGDAMKWFDGGSVCRCRVGWFDYRVSGTLTLGMASVALRISNSTDSVADLSVTLSQHDASESDATASDHDDSAILISVWRLDTASGTFVLHCNSTANAERPTHDFLLLYARAVSIDLEIPPSAVMLVVPIGHTKLSTATVLSVQTLSQFTKAGLAADFVALPRLENVSAAAPIDYESLSPTRAVAQRRNGDGSVVELGVVDCFS